MFFLAATDNHTINKPPLRDPTCLIDSRKMGAGLLRFKVFDAWVQVA